VLPKGGTMGLIFDDRTNFPDTESRLEYLKEAIQDHIGYVEFLLNTYNLWSTEGTFTFPNGETFYKNADS